MKSNSYQYGCCHHIIMSPATPEVVNGPVTLA